MFLQQFWGIQMFSIFIRPQPMDNFQTSPKTVYKVVWICSNIRWEPLKLQTDHIDARYWHVHLNSMIKVDLNLEYLHERYTYFKAFIEKKNSLSTSIVITDLSYKYTKEFYLQYLFKANLVESRCVLISLQWYK